MNTAYRRCDQAANSYYNLGLLRARERDLSGAVPCLKRALELNKNLTDARNLLALVFFELGEVGDALTHWVLSLNLQANNNRATFYLGEIQKRNGILRACGTMIQRYNSALALAQNGSEDTAVHQLSGVVAEHPNYVRAGLLLSVLYMKAGEWKKAEHSLRQVLQTDAGNADARRYLSVVEAKEQENREQKGEKQNPEEGGHAYSHRKMQDDDVIIPSTYKESTGWQTAVNIGIGLMIGAASILFLYMPTKTAELQQIHNQELIRVNEKLSEANSVLSLSKKEGSSLEEENNTLKNELNTIEESNTYKLSQYQKLIGILNDYRSENYSHAADLFATLDVSQLSDIDDESGVPVTKIYRSIAEKMNADGYVSLYQQGEAASTAGDYNKAIEFYDKALAINPEYAPAMLKKAITFKQLGDLQNANNLFGEIIMRFPGSEQAAAAKLERGY